MASEVKGLAEQTSRSVEDIGRHLERLGSVSQGVASAIGSVRESMGALEQAAREIGASIDDQHTSGRADDR